MKKKGFTLIELLAVIAIIALPTINSLIKETRMKALSNSAYGIIKAGEQYYSKKNLFDDEIKEVTFEFPEAHETLELNGEAPKSGTMTIDKNGKIEIAISNGRYCATKSFDETKVTVTEDVEQCGTGSSGNGEKTLSQLATTSTELGVTSVHACATSGTCEEGTAFAIKVNEEKTHKFYVIADDGETITLIMNQNLYEDGNTTEPDVAWINATDYTTENNKDETPDACSYTACNDEGPITALNALEERTSDWNYITAKDYTYSGLDNNGNRKYEDITRTMKARMITYSEVSTLKTNNSKTTPTWLYENLYNTGDNKTSGYWTSTAHASGSDSSDLAWYVDIYGYLYGGSVSLVYYGVRPVIELSK